MSSFKFESQAAAAAAVLTTACQPQYLNQQLGYVRGMAAGDKRWALPSLGDSLAACAFQTLNPKPFTGFELIPRAAHDVRYQKSDTCELSAMRFLEGAGDLLSNLTVFARVTRGVSLLRILSVASGLSIAHLFADTL